MNRGALVFRETYSDKPTAVKRREKLLTDPDFAEKERERSRRYYRLKRQEQVVQTTKIVFLNNKTETQRLARIRHHLARGRDAARIATWESWPLSEVNRLIELCKN